MNPRLNVDSTHCQRSGLRVDGGRHYLFKCQMLIYSAQRAPRTSLPFAHMACETLGTRSLVLSNGLVVLFRCRVRALQNLDIAALRHIAAAAINGRGPAQTNVQMLLRIPAPVRKWYRSSLLGVILISTKCTKCNVCASRVNFVCQRNSWINFGAFELASVWLKYNIRMQRAMAPTMTMANTRDVNFNGWRKQRLTGAENTESVKESIMW